MTQATAPAKIERSTEELRAEVAALTLKLAKAQKRISELERALGRALGFPC